MSKHACPIDAAQAREAELTADSLAAIRSLVPEAKDELTEDDLTCIECGMEIDPRRARLGHEICLACAQWFEKQNKQYNRRASRSYDYDD